MATLREGAAEEVESDDVEDDGLDTNLGLGIGAVVAVITVWAFFIGPQHFIELSFGDGPVIFDSRDVGNLGPIPYISGSTLVLGLLAGVGYPVISDDPKSDYQFDLSMDIVIPTVLVVAALAAVALLFPVVHFALAGDLIGATFYLFVIAVVVAIVLSGWIVIAALIIIALIYLVIPALVGVYSGSFLVRILGAMRP